ncbi:MAG: ATP-binding protein [Cyanobacteriota bacterium]
MAVSLRASKQGLEIVDRARKKKGWAATAAIWCDTAQTTPATLKRFRRGLSIQQDAFIGICKAVGIENWEEIVDESPTQQTALTVSCSVYDDNWVGREELIDQLSEKLQRSCRVLMITGITGIGKTSLAERLVMKLEGDWTEFCLVNFENRERLTDFASMAAELLTSWKETVTPDDRKAPQQLLYRLVRRLREHRYLLLIDSLERILKGNEETGWSDFEDEWWERFFESLMTAEACQSRFILTSQELPGQLEAVGLRYPNFWHCEPLTGLTEWEQLALFEKTGLEVGIESLSRSYLVRIGSAYEGHPLALRVILGEIVNQPFKGNVAAYWKKYGYEVEEVEQARQQVEVKSADDEFKLERFTRSLQRAVKKRVGLTFERLAKDVFNAYVLLCEVSVYRRPVPEDWWLSHLEHWNCDEDQQITALDALRDRYLVEEQDIEDEILLRQHNLIRSVALVHLKNLTTRDQAV